MRENMRYAHFCKICEICCDRMIAINRYPYVVMMMMMIRDVRVCVFANDRSVAGPSAASCCIFIR